MSFRVLVIPEDPTYNGYILRPLVQRLLEEAGKPLARVVVLTNPRVRGIEHARAAIRGPLRALYGHFDLWLFLPDADRARSLGELEQDLASQKIPLLCCAARPEVEAWLLAGHREKLRLPWPEVSTHPCLKEEVFEPFLAAHGDLMEPGAARGRLMEATLENYALLLRLCPELAELQARIGAYVASR